MISYLVVATFGLGFLVIVASLTVASWQDRRIKQGKRVDDRQLLRHGHAEPYVPTPWQPTADDLNDPNVPAPSDPDNSRGAQ